MLSSRQTCVMYKSTVAVAAPSSRPLQFVGEEGGSFFKMSLSSLNHRFFCFNCRKRCRSDVNGLPIRRVPAAPILTAELRAEPSNQKDCDPGRPVKSLLVGYPFSYWNDEISALLTTCLK
ncbi:hypothetical protein D3C71_1543450 [compost metagenome]